MGVKFALGTLRSSVSIALANNKLRAENADKHVSLASHVEINRVTFGRYVRIAHHAQISNSTLGDRTSVGRYTKITNSEIGKYCSISWDVTIGATQHPLSNPSTHAFWYRSQFGIVNQDARLDPSIVCIGNDVWIGCNVVIMPGVNVGDGAIIGAGSIVTRDVEPYSIVAGNPARLLRKRFPDDVIEKMIEVHWWDWDDRVIKDNIEFFSNPVSIESFDSIYRGV